MQNLQKIFPKYSIALGALFLLTVAYLIVRGNSIEVESGEVRYQELVQAVYATGFVEATSVASLSAEYSGTIDFVGAREGEAVRKGQKILSFQSPRPVFAVSEARAALAEQRAALKDAELNYARKSNLFGQGAVSRQDVDGAEKSRDQAVEMLRQREFRLRMVEDDLGKLTVRAPFAGMLTLQDVKKGDYVSAGTAVATVVDTTGYVISVEVDELDVPRVRVGQKAVIAFDAWPERRFSSVVSRVVPMTDRVTKTSKVYLTPTDTLDLIQEGMTATANIVYNVKSRALLVRKGSVFKESGRSFVWGIVEGRLKKQPIATGASDLAFVEVVGGLREGDRVALVPEERFREGMEVRSGARAPNDAPGEPK
ncbi:efflux RND transporter periplasmic adaptor subunit [Chlorobium phaeovibrioides]|uniref:Efflux RND transporter periplasmic adaptor subunit n=1 Tax=Chlorobium phaeovibrioides TaxID=1094 RepID=A0A5M8ICI0_CHLPH|nr:efflux RND transporter periplasmic adaptor subunit [Chlorobium phaeovibrioides]KAA6233091.1 efflux RND transporter periplasmic adaptor subunit [Chlorobium phaeovibrioides]